MEDTKIKPQARHIHGDGICKVLIVEDEPSLQNMYRLKFEKEGFEVYVANDGRPGLDMARKHHPDVILLDVVLNDTDGFYVLKKLKKDSETSSIPVIISSNLSTTKDINYALDNGAAGYMIKSNTTPTQLVEKVREIVHV